MNLNNQSRRPQYNQHFYRNGGGFFTQLVHFSTFHFLNSGFDYPQLLLKTWKTVFPLLYATNRRHDVPLLWTKQWYDIYAV